MVPSGQKMKGMVLRTGAKPLSLRQVSDRMFSLGCGRMTAGEKKVAGDAAASGWFAGGAGKAAHSGALVRAAAWGDGASRKVRSSNWLADDLFMKAEKSSVWSGSVGGDGGGTAART